jgi:N-terminal half of MaoC dehydratase
VPPTYAAVYALGTTVPQLFGDEEAAVDLANLLHAEQEFTWQRHPRVGETVVARGRIAADVERRGVRLITFESNVTADGSPLCHSRALFVIRSSPLAGEVARLTQHLKGAGYPGPEGG